MDSSRSDDDPQQPSQPKTSILIEVQSGKSESIKQEIPLQPLKQQTIVVESRQINVDGTQKLNFVVKGQEEKEKTPELMRLPTLQNPASNLPWQMPGAAVQPPKVVKYGAPSPMEVMQKPPNPAVSISRQPTRWSILRSGEAPLYLKQAPDKL